MGSLGVWGRYAPAVPSDEAHEHRLTLIGIAALIQPWDGIQRVVDPASDLEPNGRVALARLVDDPDKLHVVVRLAAQIQDAPAVTSDRDDFGISMPRTAGGSELHDRIEQMLGRDPEQHRPPRLSWGQLIEALANAGVSVTEQERIDAPLTIELSPQVKAQLADAGP